MQPNDPIHTDVLAREAISVTKRPRATRIHGHVPLLTLLAASALSLTGCEAVKAIFKVGAWFGALVVITIVAIIGGVAAMVMRSR